MNDDVTAAIHAKLDEHSAKLDEHTAILNEHSAKLDEHSAKLDEHSAKLDEHTAILNEHSAKLDEHTTILNEHSAKLDEHTAILNRHSAILNEHTVRLDSLSAAVSTLTGMVYDLQTRQINELKDIMLGIDRDLKSHVLELYGRNQRVDDEQAFQSEQMRRLDAYLHGHKHRVPAFETSRPLKSA